MIEHQSPLCDNINQCVLNKPKKKRIRREKYLLKNTDPLTIGVDLLRRLQRQYVLRRHRLIGWIHSTRRWFLDVIGGGGGGDGDVAELPSEVGRAETLILLYAHSSVLTQHRTHDWREKEQRKWVKSTEKQSKSQMNDFIHHSSTLYNYAIIALKTTTAQ